MKKTTFLLLTICTALNTNAQFGKLAKKGNLDAGKKLIKAATLSNEDMAILSLQSVQWMDDNNPIAESGNPYADRLQNLVTSLENEDGLTLNFQVYKVVDINAFATPDGSVRIMAGLMDLMTDAELLSVIGHEIGHVKLGHSKKRYQSAYSIAAAKDLVVTNTNAGKVLSDEDVGSLVETVANAQFSQSNESASDEYGFKFLVSKKQDYHAMSSAFQKLADLSEDGGKGSLISSHPGAAKRAARAKKWAEEQDGRN